MSPILRKPAIASASCQPWSWLATIVALLASCRPAAVRWFVVAVVVNAIQRQRRNTLAHVFNEIRERQPALANRNSTCAVISRLWVPWVQASLLHVEPAYVSCGSIKRVADGSSASGYFIRAGRDRLPFRHRSSLLASVFRGRSTASTVSGPAILTRVSPIRTEQEGTQFNGEALCGLSTS